MATDDPSDMERVDREIRINELKEHAREFPGHQIPAHEEPPYDRDARLPRSPDEMQRDGDAGEDII